MCMSIDLEHLLSILYWPFTCLCHMDIRGYIYKSACTINVICIYKYISPCTMVICMSMGYLDLHVSVTWTFTSLCDMDIYEVT